MEGKGKFQKIPGWRPDPTPNQPTPLRFIVVSTFVSIAGNTSWYRPKRTEACMDLY